MLVQTILNSPGTYGCIPHIVYHIPDFFLEIEYYIRVIFSLQLQYYLLWQLDPGRIYKGEKHSVDKVFIPVTVLTETANMLSDSAIVKFQSWWKVCQKPISNHFPRWRVAWPCAPAVGGMLIKLPAGIWTPGRVTSHPAWGYTERETHSGSGLLVQPQSWRLMDQRSHIFHLGERFWLICYFLLSCKYNRKLMTIKVFWGSGRALRRGRQEKEVGEREEQACFKTL